jgi:DNA primase
MTPSAPNSFLAVYGKHVPGLRHGSGDNYMGFCPIHGEEPGRSKPSLSVNVSTGLWFCFAGCGGGGLRTFLRKVGESSATIDRVVKNIPKQATRRRVVAAPKSDDIPERLLGLFEWCPMDLLTAGFSEKVLYENDIGYDKSLSRITFPIRDKNGKLVGVVGKQPTSEFGKYKVYTTELLTYGIHVPSFSKGDHLWRIDKVSQELKTQRKPVFVVEGFKAALWFCQAGLTNVVALMGSHMTDVQKQLIENLTPEVILCLDNDDAGKSGSVKISQKLKAARVYVVPLPEGVHQPDDMPPEELRKLCGTPVTISEAKKRWQFR